MFKFLKRAIATAFIMIAAVVGTASLAQDGPPDITAITKQGYIVIAMLGTDNAPFFSVQDGQLVGIDVDLAKSIASAMGVQPRFDRSAKSFDETNDGYLVNDFQLAQVPFFLKKLNIGPPKVPVIQTISFVKIF